MTNGKIWYIMVLQSIEQVFGTMRNKMKWYLYLTNIDGKRFVANYYGYKTKRFALQCLEQAQQLVEKGQLLKAEIVKE